MKGLSSWHFDVTQLYLIVNMFHWIFFSIIRGREIQTTDLMVIDTLLYQLSYSSLWLFTINMKTSLVSFHFSTFGIVMFIPLQISSSIIDHLKTRPFIC